jgi:hypothetical protein
MFKATHLRHLLLTTVLLSSVAAFAQHYQGHDHTVFHRPPPAKHSSNITAAGSSASRTSDSTVRRHEATLTTPASSHTAQPAQVSTRSK